MAVLAFQTAPPGVEGQLPGGETGTRAGSMSPADKRAASGESGNVADPVLMDALVKNVIMGLDSGQEPPEDGVPALNHSHGQDSREFDIVWGTAPDRPEDGSSKDGDRRS